MKLTILILFKHPALLLPLLHFHAGALVKINLVVELFQRTGGGERGWGGFTTLGLSDSPWKSISGRFLDGKMNILRRVEFKFVSGSGSKIVILGKNVKIVQKVQKKEIFLKALRNNDIGNLFCQLSLWMVNFVCNLTVGFLHLLSLIYPIFTCVDLDPDP